MNDEEAIVFVMLVIMASAIGLIWIAVTYRRRLREMEHRERLAMIERGMNSDARAEETKSHLGEL